MRLPTITTNISLRKHWENHQWISAVGFSISKFDSLFLEMHLRHEWTSCGYYYCWSLVALWGFRFLQVKAFVHASSVNKGCGSQGATLPFSDCLLLHHWPLRPVASMMEVQKELPSWVFQGCHIHEKQKLMNRCVFSYIQICSFWRCILDMNG